MLGIIGQELKSFFRGSKIVFVLSVLAFTCSCMTINLTMYDYTITREIQQANEESYGDKTFYKIDLEGEQEVYQRLFGTAEYKELLKSAFEQLRSDTSFQYRYSNESAINFISDDFPAYKNMFLSGYEEGDVSYSLMEDSLALKAYYVDRLFREEPHISLACGEWFSDEGFYVNDPNNIHCPVILGADYQELYQIGDTITDAHFGSEYPATLHVVGFLKQDSWVYDNNNDPLILDRYMVVPSLEVSYDNYLLEDGSYDEFFRSCYDSEKISNARIICNQDDVEAVEKRVYEIFHENKLYELELYNESTGAAAELESWRDSLISSMVISLFTILLSIFMFSIQAYYKIMKNKKKYAIYRMSGVTKKQIFTMMGLDTLLLFALVNMIFPVINYLLSGPLSGEKFSSVEITLETVVVLLVIELILLCVMVLFGYREVCKLDMSSTLREQE